MLSLRQSAAPPPPPIVLRFPKDDSNSSRGAAAGGKGPTDGSGGMRLVVGCLATNDPKKSSAGTFEVGVSLFLRDDRPLRIVCLWLALLVRPCDGGHKWEARKPFRGLVYATNPVGTRLQSTKKTTGSAVESQNLG